MVGLFCFEFYNIDFGIEFVIFIDGLVVVKGKCGVFKCDFLFFVIEGIGIEVNVFIGVFVIFKVEIG